jgi:hypothetical protein
VKNKNEKTRSDMKKTHTKQNGGYETLQTYISDGCGEKAIFAWVETQSR